MGKFLGKLVLIGAAIAINFVPGVGQAITGAVYGTLAGGAVGAAAAAALTFGQVLSAAITLGVTVGGIQALSGILGLGPSSPKPDTTETAVKTSRPVRTSGYGASRLYGAYILYETAENGTAVDVFAVHDGSMDGLLQLYLGDDKATLSGNTVNEGDDKRYQDGAVKMYYTDGSTPGTAIAPLVSLLPVVWTSNHRGDGVVILAVTAESVKAKKFQDTYPASGVPVGSMAARWQRCPDPHAADPTDEAGWTWTENPVRQLLHYMLVREQINFVTKIAPTIAYWQGASDVCEQPVALKAGGTEPRYRSCVSHKHTDTHASVKASLMKACDGWLGTNSQGAFIVFAGQFYAPTVEIGPDEIIAFEWAGVGRDDDDAINEIACSYVSALHDYNTVETDSWRDEDDIARRGQILSDSLEPQVPSHGQVRRLAKRQMARQNAIHRGTVSTNPAGRAVRGERFITLRLIEAGTTFYDGPVEITEVTRNIMTGGATFSWVAIDSNIDAWNPATEEGEPAPVGNRVAPQPLETPTITTATAELNSTGTGARVRIVVEGYDRDDITWFARWRSTTDASWNEQEYSDIDSGPAALLVTSVVPAEIAVDVAVAYSTGDGRVSEWSATSTVSTSTANLAPEPNTSFTATGDVGKATGSWSNSTSANFGHSELLAGTTSSFGSASQVGSDFTGPGSTTETFDQTLTAGTWFLWTLAFNASNTASARTGPIEVTVT
jgi:hypothetical protein